MITFDKAINAFGKPFKYITVKTIAFKKDDAPIKNIATVITLSTTKEHEICDEAHGLFQITSSFDISLLNDYIETNLRQGIVKHKSQEVLLGYHFGPKDKSLRIQEAHDINQCTYLYENISRNSNLDWNDVTAGCKVLGSSYFPELCKEHTGIISQHIQPNDDFIEMRIPLLVKVSKVRQDENGIVLYLTSELENVKTRATVRFSNHDGGKKPHKFPLTIRKGDSDETLAIPDESVFDDFKYVQTLVVEESTGITLFDAHIPIEKLNEKNRMLVKEKKTEPLELSGKSNDSTHSKESFNWTKWGTIATIVGLIFVIITFLGYSNIHDFFKTNNYVDADETISYIEATAKDITFFASGDYTQNYSSEILVHVQFLTKKPVRLRVTLENYTFSKDLSSFIEPSVVNKLPTQSTTPTLFVDSYSSIVNNGLADYYVNQSVILNHFWVTPDFLTFNSRFRLADILLVVDLEDINTNEIIVSKNISLHAYWENKK